MKKVFVEKENIRSNKVIIENEEFFHLIKVLRTNIGEKIVVFANDDYQYNCTITEINATNAIAKIENKLFCTRNPQIRIDVFQGLPKGEKLELIVQKITELGATSLIPFESDFSIAKENPNKICRLERITQEACKQCGRSKRLNIRPSIHINNIDKHIKDYDLVFYCYENALPLQRISNFENKLLSAKSIAIIVGSEGGFSENENDFISRLNVEKISLGRRTLKSETASIAIVGFISLLINN